MCPTEWYLIFRMFICSNFSTFGKVVLLLLTSCKSTTETQQQLLLLCWCTLLGCYRKWCLVVDCAYNRRVFLISVFIADSTIDCPLACDWQLLFDTIRDKIFTIWEKELIKDFAPVNLFFFWQPPILEWINKHFLKLRSFISLINIPCWKVVGIRLGACSVPWTVSGKLWGFGADVVV